MSKLSELQQRFEDLATEQNTLFTKAGEKDFTPEDESRFDAITLEKKSLSKAIERAREIENNEIALSLKNAKPETFAIGSKEDKVFSLERATRAAVTGKWDSEAGLEREHMQENARGGGKSWDNHTMILSPEMRSDAFSVVGTAGDGGNLVGTEYRPDKLVDALWNMSVLGKLPVVRNTGLTGNQSLPVVTSKVTANMIGETSTIADTEKITFGLKTATAKEMVTNGSFSRMLDLTSAPAIRNIFRGQIMNAIADKLDDIFVQGTGSSPIPYGILGLTAGGGTDQTKVIALGTNGAALTYANLVQMKTELAKKNIGGNLQFLTNGQVTGTLNTTLKDTANTASGYILGEDQATLLRFPIVESQTVPYTLTKGSASGVCSAIILGDFTQAEIFQWGNIAIEFDPYTGAANSLIKVRSYSFWDMIHKRPEAYVIIKDVLTTA